MTLLDRDRPSLWWRAPKGEAHKRVIPYVEGVEHDQEAIFQGNVQHAKLYGNCDLLGWRQEGGTYKRRSLPYVTENVIRSVVDTWTSIIAKNQVRPEFTTDDGSWSLQRRAKKLSLYCSGVHQQMNYQMLSADAARDAAIFGTGLIKFYRCDDVVKAERVLVDEIIVDEGECSSSSMPRSMHQRKLMDPHVLLAKFPDAEEAIQASMGGEWAGYRDASQMVVVVESWRLPSGEDTGDGRHTICVEKGTLLEEEWRHEWFPFGIYRFNKLPVGFYGQGLVEQEVGLQLELNRLVQFIQVCHKLIATPRVYVDVASKILRSHMETSKIGQVIPYRGKPPIFQTPQAVGQEIYNRIQAVKTAMFELPGISGYAARGNKPAGVESAVALRELTARDASRLVVNELDFEQLCVDSTKVIVDLTREIAADGGRPLSVLRQASSLTRTDWASADMDDMDVRISVQAASILSRTPAGRLQAAIELGQAGVVDQKTAARLLNHPDIPYAMSMQTAATEAIEKVLERIHDGDFTPPDSFMDLALCMELGTKNYLLALTKEDVPESVLSDLRLFVEMAKEAMQPQMDEMANGAPPEGMPDAMAPAPAIDPASGQPSAAFADQAMQIQASRIPA